jgi:uncharacterized protein YjiS (DUF1127 family)
MSAHVDSVTSPALSRAQDDRVIFLPLRAVCARLSPIGRMLKVWQRRRRGRIELSRLTHRDIFDFCPSLADAEQEINKPFWRP